MLTSCFEALTLPVNSYTACLALPSLLSEDGWVGQLVPAPSGPGIYWQPEKYMQEFGYYMIMMVSNTSFQRKKGQHFWKKVIFSFFFVS